MSAPRYVVDMHCAVCARHWTFTVETNGAPHAGVAKCPDCGYANPIPPTSTAQADGSADGADRGEGWEG